MPIRLLIVTPIEKDQDFPIFVASQLLLWGLAEAGIEWELYRPWDEPPDLERFQAVLFWSYRHHRRDYVARSRELEERCHAAGLPVINSTRACDVRHSYVLGQFQAHGIPCARFEKFTEFEDFGLPYPLILRRDGQHRGQHVFLAHTPDEARQIIEQRLEEHRESGFDMKLKPPLDLAIEFIDTRFPDGRYRKWRSYVVGDAIVPRQLAASSHWLVNLDTCEVTPEIVLDDRRFRQMGDENPELLRRAARALGSDIIALDYCRRSDGSYLFWEGNRHFKMTGDKFYTSSKIDEATGRSAEERRTDDEALGRALADLVLARVGLRAPAASEVA